MTRALLKAGIGAPILYFTTLVVASLTWPGYSHVTQYASELGSAAAPLAIMFGVGSLVTRANVGLWQRGYALASIPGIGVACAALLRRRE